ncbi:WhiB family transcriptional regulator [Pseudonocardia sichuanensis]
MTSTSTSRAAGARRPADAGGGEVVPGRQWRDRAACRGTDPEVFFPAAQAGPALAEQVGRAKAVCARCPVRPQCLEFALRALPEGVAGGLTPDERRAHARRARRAGQQVPARVEVDVTGRGAAVLGATPAEVGAAGRAALRAGRPVRQVARECGVSERTAQRWAQRVRAG